MTEVLTRAVGTDVHEVYTRDGMARTALGRLAPARDIDRWHGYDTSGVRVTVPDPGLAWTDALDAVVAVAEVRAQEREQHHVVPIRPGLQSITPPPGPVTIGTVGQVVRGQAISVPGAAYPGPFTVYDLAVTGPGMAEGTVRLWGTEDDLAAGMPHEGVYLDPAAPALLGPLPEPRTAHTFVLTVEVPENVHAGSLGEQLRRAAVREGARVVPCAWAPDPDTITDAVEADRVVVHDLNP